MRYAHEDAPGDLAKINAVRKIPLHDIHAMLILPWISSPALLRLPPISSLTARRNLTTNSTNGAEKDLAALGWMPCSSIIRWNSSWNSARRGRETPDRCRQAGGIRRGLFSSSERKRRVMCETVGVRRTRSGNPPERTPADRQGQLVPDAVQLKLSHPLMI